MTPSKMFFAGRSVPPGKVCTLTAPLVRASTSFAQRSIWTQGNVGAGGKFAYVSLIGSAAGAGTGAATNAQASAASTNAMTIFERITESSSG